MTNTKQNTLQKDSPTRSVLKAISWRLIASGATFIITFIIFRQYTEKTYSEIFETASIIAIIDFIAKLVLYYFHERLWTNVAWGKYWKRQAWKRRYRRMHKNQENEQ